MTDQEQSRRLLAGVESSLRRKDFDQVLDAAEGVAAVDVDRFCFELWRATAEMNDPEVGRILSYCLVRILTGPVAEASRLWILTYETDDLTTLINVLSSFQVAIVERRHIHEFQLAALPEFLVRCLGHKSVAVRVSVLDFLRDYLLVCDELPARFGRAAARALADVLNDRLGDVAEEEEVEELARVTRALRSASIPSRPRIAIDSIDDLVERLQAGSHFEALLDFIRRQRLLEHARWQAQHDRRLVLTVRVIAGDAQPLMQRVRRVADFVVMERLDRTRAPWVDAPAASTTKHFRATSATVREAFDHLRLAADAATNDRDPIVRFKGLLPRQAVALAELLVEASKANARAEFILTEPTLESPQQVVPLSGSQRRLPRFKETLKETTLAMETRCEVYSDEIPQANTVAQVFEAIEAMLARGKVTVDDISDITVPRQVRYYTQAARVLGFLDEDDEPTPQARALANRSTEYKMKAAARAFNESGVGMAWRIWAKKAHLAEVDLATAEQFLVDRAVGISGSTVPRRASTLRKWHKELFPFFEP